MAQRACKSTEKHTTQFWRLQTEKWQVAHVHAVMTGGCIMQGSVDHFAMLPVPLRRALRQQFATDMLPLVSEMEEDALGTCQAMENMQKLLVMIDMEEASK